MITNGAGAAPSPSAPALLTAQAVKGLLTGQRVLVLDDDAESFGRIFVSLASSGCRASLARRPAQIAQLLPVVRPSIVIFSTALVDDPGQLLHQLRTNAHGASSLVVALAPRDSRRERRRLLELGCHAYLSKPADRFLFATALVRAMPALLTGDATSSYTSRPDARPVEAWMSSG